MEHRLQCDVPQRTLAAQQLGERASGLARRSVVSLAGHSRADEQAPLSRAVQSSAPGFLRGWEDGNVPQHRVGDLVRGRRVGLKLLEVLAKIGSASDYVAIDVSVATTGRRRIRGRSSQVVSLVESHFTDHPQDETAIPATDTIVTSGLEPSRA